MRIIQFHIPNVGHRVGIVENDQVLDLTSAAPHFERVYDLFFAARKANRAFDEYVRGLLAAAGSKLTRLDYAALYEARPGGSQPFLRPPVDHALPNRVLISGTGLTHTGSMQSRDQMHTAAAKAETDSARMFAMGLAGGKPEPGKRGAAPEWFYKGNGSILRGHQDYLDIPGFAGDGGEEPELVGCYIVDDDGKPWRLGFCLGNEWSDHPTEKINYLYLAPSKLRTCTVGPELITGFDFQHVKLRCTIRRDNRQLYDSGELHSGEHAMCHSLANCEDHHFKYPQHRIPGDVHLHYFGTSKLSYGSRDWLFETGDEVRIEAERFSAPLVNRVRREVGTMAPVTVSNA